MTAENSNRFGDTSGHKPNDVFGIFGISVPADILGEDILFRNSAGSANTFCLLVRSRERHENGEQVYLRKLLSLALTLSVFFPMRAQLAAICSVVPLQRWSDRCHRSVLYPCHLRL
jgi:hypothetical protein